MVITQNGEAKTVLMDLQEYESTQETLAMFKSLSSSDLHKGRKTD
jgi:PHD/YefM family antitoxin component YafN of YafNO toxin-antitoxin module